MTTKQNDLKVPSGRTLALLERAILREDERMHRALYRIDDAERDGAVDATAAAALRAKTESWRNARVASITRGYDMDAV